MVRAKFRCNSLENGRIKFGVVMQSDAEKSPENPSFTTATPDGSCELMINNPKALEQFEVGKYYYADFSPEEK